MSPNSASPAVPATRSFLLKVTCPGTRGIVAAIGNYLADRNCYITKMAQFDGEAQGRYFSRVVLHTASCCRQDT